MISSYCINALVTPGNDAKKSGIQNVINRQGARALRRPALSADKRKVFYGDQRAASWLVSLRAIPAHDTNRARRVIASRVL